MGDIVTNYSLDPTEENVLALLERDPLDRRKEVFRFVQLLEAIDDHCTIALNGSWGSGKTFFVKQIKLILDSKNPFSCQSEELRARVHTLFPAVFSCDESCVTLYYDAWMNDNNIDPILSLVYASISSRQSDFQPGRQHEIWRAAGKLFDTIHETNVSDFFESLRGDDPLAQPRNLEDIYFLVKEFMDKLLEERGNRLIIFIDELDRCKPDYAIRLLERIKHYFDDERIVFVFSVSLSQLQWTVKAYYGGGFDATRYLDKFFDLHISLPDVDRRLFLEQRLRYGSALHGLSEVCVKTAQYFKFSLREMERYARLVRIAMNKNSRALHETGFSDEKAHYFALNYVVPICIGMRMHNFQTYRDCIDGKNAETMIRILEYASNGIYQGFLLGPNEKQEDDFQKEDGRKTVKSYAQKLEEVHHALFVETFDDEVRELTIGKMSFSSETRKNVMDILTLLSPFADYRFE